MTSTATRRTLSGKRIPASTPRRTWQDLVIVRTPVAPQAETPAPAETPRERKNRLARERRAAARCAA